MAVAPAIVVAPCVLVASSHRGTLRGSSTFCHSDSWWGGGTFPYGGSLSGGGIWSGGGTLSGGGTSHHGSTFHHESVGGTSKESYVPTVFENYTASFEIDTQRIELSLWDTSGSPYYDNVRPLSYPDSDAVLICFDISRPETLDSVLKKWKGEIQEFCPNTKMLLVGCKSDLRTDVSTLVELSNHRQTPVSYDQGANMAKQIGAATYIECSALQSENSVRDIFHVATLACVNKTNKNVKRNKSQRATKRISHMPGRPELSTVATDLRKDKAKSCTVM
ncbi:rho-related GTP-binding protein RhoE [Geospiza fortis]|uniref:Rho-related GTP-binding protein RhoE n=1 Tax=Geospiza fortis TaxID=48883 RepID=A0A6I9HCD3_GEOFO|nr:rho-related GTP-binding protein RhoE [Geospiza fortis]